MDAGKDDMKLPKPTLFRPSTTPTMIPGSIHIPQSGRLFNSTQPQPPPGPSLSSVGLFIESFLPPPRQGDVPYLYHIPRQPKPGALPPSMSPISKIVLSITPTPGFYSGLASATGPVLGFLHRPFTLDRFRVPRVCTILACHKGFDEVLTVGYNTALGQRVGVDVEASVCLQGYKGDPERRIGIVGPLLVRDSEAIGVRARIREEFGVEECEGEFGFEVSGADGLEGGGVSLDQTDSVSVVAIMNAFRPEEVERVVEAAVTNRFIASTGDANKILYLTGAVRAEGLAAATEKGVKVMCVGHRICEEWGVRYLAAQLRERFPEMQVEEVYEDEEPPPSKEKRQRQPEARPPPGDHV